MLGIHQQHIIQLLQDPLILQLCCSNNSRSSNPAVCSGGKKAADRSAI
ncbi:MAG UNVERIFIED_CONTAM: hypothetical protein LVR18_46560 [Planctomycetaceae bacterium]